MQISEDHYREVVTAKARRLVLYVTRDQWAPALSRHRFLLFEIINIQSWTTILQAFFYIYNI